MSRAFIKEDAEDPDDLPDRLQSAAPNYVTPEGMAALRRKAIELEERLALLARDSREGREVLRDLRYYKGRIARAIPVDAAGRPPAEARFGAFVDARGPDGTLRTFHVVGQDEALDGGERISWDSSLALAMMGAKVGDKVEWEGETGTMILEIAAIRYPPRGSA